MGKDPWLALTLLLSFTLSWRTGTDQQWSSHWHCQKTHSYSSNPLTDPSWSWAPWPAWQCHWSCWGYSWWVAWPGPGCCACCRDWWSWCPSLLICSLATAKLSLTACYSRISGSVTSAWCEPNQEPKLGFRNTLVLDLDLGLVPVCLLLLDCSVSVIFYYIWNNKLIN